MYRSLNLFSLGVRNDDNVNVFRCGCGEFGNGGFFRGGCSRDFENGNNYRVIINVMFIEVMVIFYT